MRGTLRPEPLVGSATKLQTSVFYHCMSTLPTAGLDPTSVTALGRSKAHSHEVGDGDGAFAKVKQSVTYLHTALSEMARLGAISAVPVVVRGVSRM